jgi:hypothetical protein
VRSGQAVELKANNTLANIGNPSWAIPGKVGFSNSIPVRPILVEMAGDDPKNVHTPILPVFVPGKGFFNFPASQHSIYAWFEIPLVPNSDDGIEDYSPAKKIDFTSDKDVEITYGDFAKNPDGWGERNLVARAAPAPAPAPPPTPAPAPAPGPTPGPAPEVQEVLQPASA